MAASSLTVSHDADGGVTVKDSRTGVVVSIISRGPDDDPLLFVEPYAWRARLEVHVEEVPARNRAIVYALSAKAAQ